MNYNKPGTMKFIEIVCVIEKCLNMYIANVRSSADRVKDSKGDSRSGSRRRWVGRSIFRFVDIDATDVFEAVPEFFIHEHRGA